MFIDISFEYDCAHEEFIYKNIEKFLKSDIWVSFHTNDGKQYLENQLEIQQTRIQVTYIILELLNGTQIRIKQIV